MGARTAMGALPLAALLAVATGCDRRTQASPTIASTPARAATSATSAVATPIASAATGPSEGDRPWVGGGPSAVYGAPPPSGPLLSTTRFTSYVYEKPSFDARWAGFLRAGTRVVRGEKASGQPGKCTWYAIEPTGYVCDGAEGITSNLDDAAVKAASLWHPDTSQPFPYPGYGTSRGARLYARVPTAAEERGLEGDLARRAADYQSFLDGFEPAKRPPAIAMPLSEVPFFLKDGGHVPNVLGLLYPKGALTVGSSSRGMRLAFQAAFESDGRSYYYTSEGWVVPTEDVRVARLADFHGVELAREGDLGEHLPFVWAIRKPARVFVLDEASQSVAPLAGDVVLPWQGHFEILDAPLALNGVRYLEIKNPPASCPKGARCLVRFDEVARIDAAKELPFKAEADELWIDVNIAKQALVVYRGLQPIFATLVSTGSDYLGDPASTHATPRGMFRIYAKHISVKMAADEKPPKEEGGKPERAYRIDDVPYVQYFSAGYAFHAAYWHDDFGQPRSHGCINLSPKDAMWLFHRTSPAVPSGWHSVFAGRAGVPEGTLVVIRTGIEGAPWQIVPSE